jgi:tRNA (guanine-N7-)-methyltransferase
VAELIPPSYLAPLEIEQIFGRRAALEVDLGCGDGTFLAALADSHPAHNFLGIERLAGRVRTASRKATRLPNVRILRMETSYAVRYLLPAESVTVFYLLFPDPWPKRRHHRRRIFTTEFLDALAVALVPGGSLRVATDQADYFEQIERTSRACPGLQSIAVDGESLLPATTFEKRFVRAGAPIYRLELRKVSPVR